MQDVRRRVARVFVASENEPTSINGVDALSASSFEKELPTPDNAKRLPHYPNPAILISRLAVDLESRGQGLRETLMMDVFIRVTRVSEVIAVYAIIVDAKNDEALAFYIRYGFLAFETMPYRLYEPLDSIRNLNLEPS